MRIAIANGSFSAKLIAAALAAVMVMAISRYVEMLKTGNLRIEDQIPRDRAARVVCYRFKTQ